MSSLDEHGDPWGSEAEVDRLLRQEFDRTFAADERPNEVLKHLRPSIRRAHTIHRMQRTAVGAAAVAVLIAGVAGVARLIPNGDVGLTVAGQVDGDGNGTQHSDEGQELAVNGTTTLDDGDAIVHDGRNGDAPEGTDGTEGTEAGAAAGDTQTGNNGVESTTDSAPSPSAPTTTTATPTTPRSSSNATTRPTSSSTTDRDSTTSIQPDGFIAVITACGRIIVDLNRGDLALVEIQPDPGFRADLKESTSRLIEVGLERESGHCEVKIRPSGNGLDVVVKTEGEHDHE